jgi:hypothetical protein
LADYLRAKGCIERFYLKIGDELPSIKLWVSLAKEWETARSKLYALAVETVKSQNIKK